MLLSERLKGLDVFVIVPDMGSVIAKAANNAILSAGSCIRT